MALVGARMESVAPKRSLFGPDYLLLLALLAISAAVHIWLVANTKVTARDSVGFARQALRIQSPEMSVEERPLDPTRMKIDVIREAEHPPGYPLAVWVTAKFVRRTLTPENAEGLYSVRQISESTLLATQIASSIAAFLLVIPMYLTGRMLFGRAVGFASALLFQVLPGPAHITSDGLTEGLYLLMMSTSLMFAVRAVRRPGVGGFLLTGLAVGASYLVRPEALIVAAGVALVAGWLGYTRLWPRDLTLGRLTALGVGLMLVAGPYMIVIGGVSNKPSVKGVVPEEMPRGRLMKAPENAHANPAAAPLFAMWMSPSLKEEGIPARLLFGARAATAETVKTLYYVPAVFALVGLISLRRRIAAEPGLWVLLVVAGLNTLLITVYVGAYVGYVSERHTMLLALIGCLFAAAGLEPVSAALGRLPGVGFFWAGKFGVPALLVILVGAALPATLRPMHSNREGFKHAGYWLEQNVKKGDCVIDPFSWAEWYAGRSLYYVPKDPPADPPPEVTYAIVDNRSRDDHERLGKRMEAARNVLNDGRRELVYSWPEGSNEATAKVMIYRLIRKSK